MAPVRRELSEVLPRLLVDLFLINVALVVAQIIRTFITFQATTDLAQRAHWIEQTVLFYRFNAPLVSGVSLLVFVASGFYSRTRFYRRRYKLIAVAQGAMLSALGYVTLGFLLNRDWILPRTVVILTFLGIFVLCGGLRVIKWQIEQHFSIQPKVSQARDTGPRIILIIGGAGHIGSLLCRLLLRTGYRVRVLDMLMFGDGAISELFDHPNFEFIEGDFRHVEQVVRSTKGAYAVIHLGAIVGDPACAVDEDYSVDVNYAATRMIREVCRGFGTRRFIFASTCSVYGASDHILDERSQLRPVSLYAQTKVDSENAVLSLADSTFSPTVLRFATIFGYSPRPRFDLVINIVTAMAVRDGKCAIFGGDQWRPFLHVEDAARGVLCVLESPEELVGGEVFNVGDDRFNMQLRQVGDLVEKLIPEAVVERQEDNVDRRNYRVSFQKIRERLGFECKNSVESGIEEIRDALTSGLVDDFRDPKYSNLNYLNRLRELGAPVTQSTEDPRRVVKFVRR